MMQFICKFCMSIERTAAFEEFKQNGAIVPWNDYTSREGVDDSKLWKEGKIFCPHRRHELLFVNALLDCLRSRAHSAAQNGALFPMDEVVIN
jgi:hypothetical protein